MPTSAKRRHSPRRRPRSPRRRRSPARKHTKRGAMETAAPPWIQEEHAQELQRYMQRMNDAYRRRQSTANGGAAAARFSNESPIPRPPSRVNDGW